jgi:hypothetical protein
MIELALFIVSCYIVFLALMFVLMILAIFFKGIVEACKPPLSPRTLTPPHSRQVTRNTFSPYQFDD